MHPGTHALRGKAHNLHSFIVHEIGNRLLAHLNPIISQSTKNRGYEVILYEG